MNQYQLTLREIKKGRLNPSFCAPFIDKGIKEGYITFNQAKQAIECGEEVVLGRMVRCAIDSISEGQINSDHLRVLGDAKKYLMPEYVDSVIKKCLRVQITNSKNIDN